jgi:hypothetical protein
VEGEPFDQRRFSGMEIALAQVPDLSGELSPTQGLVLAETDSDARSFGLVLRQGVVFWAVVPIARIACQGMPGCSSVNSTGK